MEEINVIQPDSDSLIYQLKCLYDLFREKKQDSKIFNFKSCNWVSPLPILAICAYRKETGSVVKNINPQISTYLDTIGFPEGVKSEKEMYESSYIPISFLEKTDPLTEREKIEGRFYELIHESIGGIVGTKNAISYPVGELISNIFEHSKKNYGWIFAQTYQKKRILDICIIDSGRGFVRGYKEERGLDFSDIEALKKALVGFSIKKEKGRGCGIRSSIKVVCEGFGGSFIILSGNSFYYQRKNKKRIVNLPDFYWSGVIVAYQIPYPDSPIDISRYY